jgi:hypothetical protein
MSCATLIVAIRLPDQGPLLADLFSNAALPWILGAVLLAVGLIVIAFHQYWYSPTAVMISLFGWFVALRGLAMMAFPSEMQTGASQTLTSPGLLLAARLGFAMLAVIGGWLTYVGWLRRAPTPDDVQPL